MGCGVPAAPPRTVWGVGVTRRPAVQVGHSSQPPAARRAGRA